jgi:hypothetical protein
MGPAGGTAGLRRLGCSSVKRQQRLKGCEQLLDGYAEQAYRAVHQPLGGDGGA